MIDTHSHIYLENFDSDREKVIAQALETGITKILMPNIDAKSIKTMLATETQFPDICLSMMGLHPTSIKSDYIKELKIIEKELEKRDYIAIGEIGMDLYWDTTFAQEQKEALSIHLQWAKEKNVPAVIHTRNAFPEIFDIIYKEYSDKLSGVFHSFSGSLEDAEKIKQMKNFYIGVNGTVTYKNSNLSDILYKIGYEKLLLETDAPYLPPVPYRGKRNEPAFMMKTAEKIAEIFSVKVEKIVEVTTRNVEILFEV